jgi:hypothetical protein
MTKNKIDKKKTYKHIEGGIFKVWSGEDFSGESILLYETTTGEDISIDIGQFWSYMTEDKE